MGRLYLITMLLLMLSACSDAVDNKKLRVDVIADEGQILSVTQSPLPKASAYLRAATAQGLVTYDKKGRVVPALASRWMLAKDKLSYAFRLKKTRWNNGNPVDAKDIAVELNNRIAVMRNAGMRRELSNIKSVRKMTGRVLEIQLKAPMPNLLEYLAMPSFGIIHKSNGSGPVIAKKQDNGMYLRLRKEENSEEIALRNNSVTLSANTAQLALARFNRGDSDMVTGGDFTQYPMLQYITTDDAIIDSDNMAGLFGLLLVEAGPFLSDKNNREAIMMAMDRPRMLTSFNAVKWNENKNVVPTSLRDRGKVQEPSWFALNMPERINTARKIIAVWKTENGNVRPLRIAIPNSSGGRILFAWIKSDLANIGLQTKRVNISQSADFRMVDKVASSSSSAWYLEQLSCAKSRICSKEADAVLDLAFAEKNTAERKRLFGEAETILQEERTFIPLANPLRWSIYRDGLLGYESNARDWHYLQYLGSDPT